MTEKMLNLKQASIWLAEQGLVRSPATLRMLCQKGSLKSINTNPDNPLRGERLVSLEELKTYVKKPHKPGRKKIVPKQTDASKNGEG